MKQGWEIKKLGDFCKVIAGQSPKGSSYNANGVGVEFHQGKKAFGADVIEPSNVWTTEATRLAEAGDILISVRAPVGPTNFTDREVCIGRGLAAIRCTPMVLPQFILYALKNIEDKIVGKDGAVFNSINKDMIEDLPVPMLGIAEQERIVEILDREFERIDVLKANAEQNLQHAKDLFQAALKQELQPKEGWGISKLSDVVRVINGRAYRKEELLPSGKYRVLRVGNFFTNDSWYYSNLELEEEKYCEEGDLLYAWSASFGPKIWNGEKVIYHYHIWKIVPNCAIDKLFLFYWLQSPHLTNQVMSNLHGTTMAHITKGIMEATSISCPSIQEQVQIVSRLEELNERCKALEENHKKTIVLCDDMKQALLRKAFNGEL